MLNQNEFQQRRASLLAKMQANSIAIITSNQEVMRNGDANYRFRQDSYFAYLTGFEEPQAVLILMPGTKDTCQMFVRERNKEMEIWNGKRAGLQGVIDDFGMHNSYDISELDERILDLMIDKDVIYYCHAHDFSLDKRVSSWCNKLKARVRKGITAPQKIFNLEQIIDEMRLIKSEWELNMMRHAAKISANAHKKAMQQCQGLGYEYQLEAILSHEFIANGCRTPAYDPIVGAGANSCILHYTQNNARLSDGDLVLIDAGAEWHNYAADITRTFPVNGRFSQEQKEIYIIVLKAQLAGIECAVPGRAWDEMQKVMVKIITEGLVELGILKGDVDTLIQTQAYREFYMHNSGHFLGLDVHDVGNYKKEDKWRCLEKGMVLTVEPGIYIAGDNPNVAPKWWNIGIRIEDDIIITESGNEVISEGAPKTVDEIEALMNLSQ
jgi:Xaa-Pro aminopeptidase